MEIPGLATTEFKTSSQTYGQKLINGFLAGELSFFSSKFRRVNYLVPKSLKNKELHLTYLVKDLLVEHP